MNEQATSKERVLPKTDLEWIAHTLSDAEAAIKVLSTMLAKEGLKMGFAVADEILGNVRSAQKNCSHLIERDRRTAHEPPADEHPDKARLDWLNEQPVHFIELDDFSIIDVRGLDVRAALDARRNAPTKESAPADPDEETPCPKRDDGIHCECWYGGNPCCGCGREDILDGRAKPPCSGSGERGE